MPRLNYYHQLLRDLLDDLLEIEHYSHDQYCFSMTDYNQYHNSEYLRIADIYQKYDESLSDLIDRYSQVMKEHEVINKQWKF